MKRNVKRFCCLLLAAAMLAGCLPAFSGMADLGLPVAPAPVAEAAGNGKAIQLKNNGCMTNIQGSQKSTVYFGNYNQSRSSKWSASNKEYNVEPIKWRVLSNMTSIPDNYNGVAPTLLLSDQLLDKAPFNTTSQDVKWNNSSIRTWLNSSGSGFYNTAFSDAEKAAIVNSLIETGTTLTNDKVFLLSAVEAESFGFAENRNATPTRVATLTPYCADGGQSGTAAQEGAGKAAGWWLRSAGAAAKQARTVSSTGQITDNTAVNSGSFNVRPAVNLDPSDVLFTSAAKNGKNTTVSDTLQPIGNYSGNEWKLTVHDPSYNFKVTKIRLGCSPSDIIPNDNKANVTCFAGVKSSIVFNYDGANIGPQDYISAILTDRDGNAAYYSRLEKADQTSDSYRYVDLPALSEGTYTLLLFNEQCNGDYETDYASAVCNITLTVEKMRTVTVGQHSATISKGGEPAYFMFVPTDTNTHEIKSLDTGEKRAKYCEIYSLQYGEGQFHRWRCDTKEMPGPDNCGIRLTKIPAGAAIIVSVGYEDDTVTGSFDFSIWGIDLEISKQPQNETVYAGEKALFSVKANFILSENDGETTTYQWEYSPKNSEDWYPVSSATEGATEKDLWVTAQQNMDGYKYRCRMTNQSCNNTPLYSAPAYLWVKERDLITYGSYPQTEVTDPDLLAQLELADKRWRSYGYYSGTGKTDDGQMRPGDYMQYADFFYGATKYGAVKFSGYRPKVTGWPATEPGNSFIASNGYYKDKTYYFVYEPLRWRLLDSESGLLLCDSIIDAQPYLSAVIKNGSEYYNALEDAYYANNYGHSSIRDWLNNEFLEVAFSPDQQAGLRRDVAITTKAETAEYAKYNSDPLSVHDSVYLLSIEEVRNESYGLLKSTYLNATGTDYAKCQGLSVHRSDDSFNGRSWWLLRTPCNNSNEIRSVPYSGYYGSANVYSTGNGVRPAIRLKKVEDNNEVSDLLYSEGWHISDRSVSLSWTKKTYNGTVQKPEVTVKNTYGNVLKEGTDYTLSWSADSKNVGTYTVTATGMGSYSSSGSATYSITPEALDGSSVSLEWSTNTYNCAVQHPTVTVKNARGETLKEDADYTLVWSGNCKDVGSHEVTVFGANNYKESVEKTFSITKQTLSAENISLSFTDTPYNGEVQKPAVTVKSAEGVTLQENTDYTLKFTGNCKDVGPYAITVTGTGNFEGSEMLMFSISNRTTHTHTWDAGKVTKAATCAQEGEKTFTCTAADCGATKTEAIPKTADHEWDDGKVTKEATETEEGEMTFTCIVCGTKKTEPIPKKTPGTVDFLLGDVDGNGKIQARDARLALRAAVGLETYPAGTREFLAADVTHDEKITAKDARQILRAAVGMEKLA